MKYVMIPIGAALVSEKYQYIKSELATLKEVILGQQNLWKWYVKKVEFLNC